MNIPFPLKFFPSPSFLSFILIYLYISICHWSASGELSINVFYFADDTYLLFICIILTWINMNKLYGIKSKWVYTPRDYYYTYISLGKLVLFQMYKYGTILYFMDDLVTRFHFLHEISWNDTRFFLLILNWQTLTPLSKSKRLFDPGQLRKFDFILKIGNQQAPIGTITEAKVIRERQPIFLKCIILKTCNVHKSSPITTLIFFYKKPTTWRVGSTFLRKPRFEAQKFLNFVQISAFTFLTFPYFQP